MIIRAKIGEALWRLGRNLAIGYDGAESDRMRRDLSYGRTTARDEDSLVSEDRTREFLRLRGYDLYRNNAIVAGFCQRLSSFVVGTGLRPQARTSDEEINKLYEAFWERYAGACDYRQRVNMHTLQSLAVSLRPTHGGYYLQLMDNGQVRPIECERIRIPTKPEEQKGQVDGVRVDPATGRRLAYSVHSRAADGTFSGKHAETWVPAESMIPVISDPWRLDQVREIPDLAPVLPALIDIHEMNLYTLNTAKSQMQHVGFIKKLPGGSGGVGLKNMGMRGYNNAPVNVRQTVRVDWGTFHELLPGEEIGFPNPTAPTEVQVRYVAEHYKLIAAGMDVPYEFLTLDFSTADFSRMKSVLLLVNKFCRNRRKWLADAMLHRLWSWRIAKAIRDGELPAAPVDARGKSEWCRVEWHGDEEPWVDRQSENQADMLEYQLGLTTLRALHLRRGKDTEQTLREKAKEVQLIQKIAAEFQIHPDELVKAQIPGQTDAKQVAVASEKVAGSPAPAVGET